MTSAQSVPDGRHRHPPVQPVGLAEVLAVHRLVVPLLDEVVVGERVVEVLAVLDGVRQVVAARAAEGRSAELLGREHHQLEVRADGVGGEGEGRQRQWELQGSDHGVLLVGSSFVLRVEAPLRRKRRRGADPLRAAGSPAREAPAAITKSGWKGKGRAPPGARPFLSRTGGAAFAPPECGDQNWPVSTTPPRSRTVTVRSWRPGRPWSRGSGWSA